MRILNQIIPSIFLATIICLSLSCVKEDPKPNFVKMTGFGGTFDEFKALFPNIRLFKGDRTCPKKITECVTGYWTGPDGVITNYGRSSYHVGLNKDNKVVFVQIFSSPHHKPFNTFLRKYPGVTTEFASSGIKPDAIFEFSEPGRETFKEFGHPGYIGAWLFKNYWARIGSICSYNNHFEKKIPPLRSCLVIEYAIFKGGPDELPRKDHRNAHIW